MNCMEFRNLIHDLAREDVLDNSTLSDALTHAESCRVCDAQLQEAERLTADLRQLATRDKSKEAAPYVEEALLDAFRQRRIPASRLTKVSAWIAISAAGLAAAMLLTLVLTRHPILPFAPSPTGPEAAPRESNTKASPRAVSAEYDVQGETEDAADAFVPLSPTFDPSWLEDSAVVRVSLSDAALENLGLGPNELGDGEVIADLVVRNDGTPEAIRLVDPNQ
jgi:hypothetical protein